MSEFLYFPLLFALCCTCISAVGSPRENDLFADMANVTTANQEIPQQQNKSPLEKRSKQPQKLQKGRYMIPCLTVLRGTDNGDLSYLPMRFTRNNGNHPLRIQIGDDTPHGSSETIRINVWMAAITAAMLRNDTLHGVNISVDFSGNIDGNSAGGVTCLAILSAIDGLPLPNDFAMTGTIMPDGSIGVVGGVHAKIRAAARSGKKRVLIPVYPRFEKDHKGNEIDLLRLGESLNIKVFRVTTVAEAYAIVHNKTQKTPPHISSGEISRLPRKIEDVLTGTFRKYQRLVRQKVKASPNNARVQIVRHYDLSPARAEALFGEGKLLFATLQMIRTYKAWLAFENTLKLYSSRMPDQSWKKRKYLKEYYFRKTIIAFNKALASEIKKFAAEKSKLKKADIARTYPGRQMQGYFPYSPEQTEITAQLELMDSTFALKGELQILENQRPAIEHINSANAAALDKILGNEINIAALGYLQKDYLRSENEFYTALGAAMPRLRHNRYATHVEELFYTAGIAAKNIADDHIRDRLKNPNRASAKKSCRSCRAVTTSTPS